VIWTPLLGSVAANHAHFSTILTSRIITHLLSDDSPTDEPNSDDATTTATAAAAEKASYDVCLATWATWLIEWRRSADETDLEVTTRRQAVFFQLAQVLATPKHEKTSPGPQTGCVPFSQLNRGQSRVTHHHHHHNNNNDNWLLWAGRGRFSPRCVPRIGSSLEF
jgi:hypothetical protein